MEDDYLVSETDASILYPIIDGIPILINEENSLFSIKDFMSKRTTTILLGKSKIKAAIRKIIPSISLNIKARDNYHELVTIIPDNSVILIIGGSIQGNGIEEIYSNESYEIIESDVSFGPFTKIISDAHNIPFENGIFDCVIIQAVLEHVLNPQRCVNEIFRVLKPSGIVYAETPFMQQVHIYLKNQQ